MWEGRVSAGDSVVKNQPVNAGNPLEKGMATPSSVLTREIPLTEEAGGLQSRGSLSSDTTQ